VDNGLSVDQCNPMVKEDRPEVMEGNRDVVDACGINDCFLVVVPAVALLAEVCML
jgi:hypothetical protein